MENSRRGLFWKEGGRWSLWGIKCKEEEAAGAQRAGKEHSGRESVSAKAWRQEDPTFLKKYKKLAGGRDGEEPRKHLAGTGPISNA